MKNNDVLIAAGIGCGLILLWLALILGISAFMGWLFMLLWNFAVASTFGIPELSFYVAWAIWFLIGMITPKFRVRIDSKDKK